MKTMFTEAKGFKLRRNAAKRLADVAAEFGSNLEHAYCFILTKDDGTYLPVVKLLEGDRHWMRPLVERGCCVTD